MYLGGYSDAASQNSQLITLSRYDVQAGTTTAITNGAIKTAQISHDGQWLLLSVVEDSVSKIQLIRMDGKYRQTLYCAPQGQLIDPTDSTGMQWSPDQKHVIFSQGTSYNIPQSLYMLDLSSGAVQLEFSPTGNNENFLPTIWLDNTRVCVKSIQVASFKPSSLYLLDTSKGSNQHVSDMQLLRNVGGVYWWSFDTSVDVGTLYMSTLKSLQSPPYYQSEIDADSIDGGNSKQILLSNTLVITDVRALNSSSLMFVSYTQSGTQAQDDNFGWWKINSDGSGLTRLNKYPHEGGAGPGVWGPFNPYTQNPWSNFSRDGSLYTDGTSYGSLNGGALTSYTNNSGAALVGWTTM